MPILAPKTIFHSPQWALTICLLSACGGTQKESLVTTPVGPAENVRSASLEGAKRPASHDAQCNAKGENSQVIEYDTSGDSIPDVRKIYTRVGDLDNYRLIPQCREVDLNGDGTKDIVRHYNEDGKAFFEEIDRDFDGTMEEVIFFEDRCVVSQEIDALGHDGQVDTKIYYKDGKPIRIERDTANQSSANEWKPTQWEHIEADHTIRVGTDVDHDGTVDRWDRDQSNTTASSEKAVNDNVRALNEGSEKRLNDEADEANKAADESSNDEEISSP